MGGSPKKVGTKKRTSRRKPAIPQEEPLNSSAGLPKTWSQEEIEALLVAIKKNGHENVKELCKLVNGKSEHDILEMIKTSAINGRKQVVMDPKTLDYWIKILQNNTLDSKTKRFKQCLPVATVLQLLSVDGALENQPLVEKCDGIDFCAAYKFLYQSVMGYPQQPINKQTLNFINKSINELGVDCVNNTELFDKMKEILQPQFPLLTSEQPIRVPLPTLTVCGKEDVTVQKPTKTYQRKRKFEDNSQTDPFVCKISCPQTGLSIDVDVPAVNAVAPREDLSDLEKLLKDNQYNPLELPKDILSDTQTEMFYNTSTSSQLKNNLFHPIFSAKKWHSMKL